MIRKIPIGKKVGSILYVHRDYVERYIDEIIPRKIFEEAKKYGYTRLGLGWNIAKWDKMNDTFSFINCPTFDIDPEPQIESVTTVNLRTKERKYRFYGSMVNSDIFPCRNPPIYHYKWLMVGDGYRAFLVSRARRRSLENERIIKKYGIDKSRIGYKKYWEEVVLPLIQRER